MFEQIRQFLRDNPRMWVVVCGGVVLAGTIIWSVWGGLGLQIGQFFAAEPTNTPGIVVRDGRCFRQTQEPGQCPPGEAVCYGLPEGCGWTSDRTVARELRVGGLDWDLASNLLFNPGAGDPNDLSTWQWFDPPQTIEEWCTPDFQLSRASAPANRPYSPAGVRCPDRSSGGQDFGSYPSCGSMVTTEEEVACPFTPTPIATPTPTPTPVPIVTLPLQCYPDTQVVALGESARVYASGGNGRYIWSASGGGIQNDGGTDFAAYSFLVPGIKRVTVRSGTETTLCEVTAGDEEQSLGGGPILEGPTTTPQPTPIEGPAGVPTGPGDAVMIALACAVLGTLVYASYTRSPGFRMREAERIVREQEPMDFHS